MPKFYNNKKKTKKQVKFNLDSNKIYIINKKNKETEEDHKGDKFIVIHDKGTRIGVTSQNEILDKRTDNRQQYLLEKLAQIEYQQNLVFNQNIHSRKV